MADIDDDMNATLSNGTLLRYLLQCNEVMMSNMLVILV